MSFVRMPECFSMPGVSRGWGACVVALLLLGAVAADGQVAEVAPAAVGLRWDGKECIPEFLAPQAAVVELQLDKIPDLIRQLGDETYAKRQAAGQALAAFGGAAREPLENAARDSDPEVATSARKLADAIVRREKARKTNPPPLLALSLPVRAGDSSKCLACIYTNPIQPNVAMPELSIALPEVLGETRSEQWPFFLLLGGRPWQPVPMWMGPRWVPVPGDAAQLPLRPVLDMEEYDLLTELDENWQPTTAKASARVKAVAHYLAVGGNVNHERYAPARVQAWAAAGDQLLPAVPVPAWVATLRQRLARGDIEALSGLVSLRAAPSVDEMLRLLKEAQDPARGAILGVLRNVDPKLCAAAVRELLNGRYANDAPLLEVLGEAGVALEPAKLNYPASEFEGKFTGDHDALVRYCRRMGLKVPDGLVEAWVASSKLFVDCTELLSAGQVEALKKRLKDRTGSERALFHARCLLLQVGDQTQEAELMTFFPPGTPYQSGYNSRNFGDYCRFVLCSLAGGGRFPRLAQQLMREGLFESDKIHPQLRWMLSLSTTPEQVAEISRKLDDQTVKNMSWHLGYWRCRAAVPWMIKMLDAGGTNAREPGAGMVVPLSYIADPAAGPCLVRTIERLEKSGQYPDMRLRALEGLLWMGNEFPEGNQTMLRVSTREKRFSAFRMVALAGLARYSPDEGLAPLLREIEAAPPCALPLFLKWLSATRLPGVVPVLKKHLKHRYPPVARSAARALLEQGDRTVLPLFHEQRFWWRQDWDLARSLLAYWRDDTSAEEVQMIRETLDVIGYPARCASRAEWANELLHQSADY